MKFLLTVILIGIATLATAQQKLPKIDLKDTTVYTEVEQQPKFGRDENDFNKYLGRNVRFVASDTLAHGIQGNFLATFIVEKNGTLSHIKILRPTWDSATGRLFVKVLQQCPKWYPGINKGYAVRVRFSVPIIMCFGSE